MTLTHRVRVWSPIEHRPDAAPAPLERQWVTDDVDGEAFGAVVEAVLSLVWQLLPLSSLRLDVPGVEHVAVQFARRSTQPPEELVSWSVPIPASDWFATGAVSAAARTSDEVTARRVVDQAAALIGHLISADQRRRQSEELARRALTLAGTDPLTQLGNRRAWQRALTEEQARATRHGTWTSLLVLDLDRLKQINDSAGHSAGDALLCQTASLLLAFCRSVDFVARLGGDEFGVLAPQTGTPAAAAVSHRLRDRFDSAGIAVSIGAATARAGSDLDEAWRQADLSMYADKMEKRKRRPVR